MVQVENHDWKIDGILPAKHIPAKRQHGIHEQMVSRGTVASRVDVVEDVGS